MITPGAVVGDIAAKAVGSDIDYIVNAQDFAAYVSAITNAILNRMFAEGVGLLHASLSGRSGTTGGTAQQQCASFLGTPAYAECLSAVQAGINVREFQKNYLIRYIDLDLVYQNQLLGAKQATLTILNQSLSILRQLETCQGFPSPDTARVQSDISTVTGQIADIQSDIIALQLLQQQIRNLTDLSRIASIYAEVVGMFSPGVTQSLALAAQQETNQKQIILRNYQNLLNACLESRIIPPPPPGE